MWILVGTRHKLKVAFDRISCVWYVCVQASVTGSSDLHGCIGLHPPPTGAQFPAVGRTWDVRQGATTQEAEKENDPWPVRKPTKGPGRGLVLSICRGPIWQPVTPNLNRRKQCGPGIKIRSSKGVPMCLSFEEVDLFCMLSFSWSFILFCS